MIDFSRLLLQRHVLWLLFTINALGTVYGFMWYAQQMANTMASDKPWLVLFVPDSPTASLLFTITLLFLLRDQYAGNRLEHSARSIIEVLAVVTSVKYGIWAVVMIAAGYAQGNTL